MLPHPERKRDSKEIPNGFKGRFERQRAEEADRNKRARSEREGKRRRPSDAKSPANPTAMPAPAKKKRFERLSEAEIHYFGRKIGMSIEATVAVVKEGRGVFNVEETLEIRRFVMDRMLDVMAPISFIDSGLMRGSTLYLMTCGSSAEACKLVQLCHQQAKEKYQWLFCRAEDLPLPPRIRGTVLGLSLQKDKILKFMKLVNHKLGLSIDKWTLVGFDRDRFGQRTTLTIEVPDKDADIVRRIGSLGVELTQVHFRVLPVQRWGDMDECTEESRASSSPPIPSAPAHNQTENSTVENPIIIENGMDLKDRSIFPDGGVPPPPIRTTSAWSNNDQLHQIKLPPSFQPLTEPLTPTSPVDTPKGPSPDLYNSPEATSAVDEAFVRTWKGMENFENM